MRTQSAQYYQSLGNRIAAYQGCGPLETTSVTVSPTG